MSPVIRCIRLIALATVTLFSANSAQAQTIEGGPAYVAFTSCPEFFSANQQLGQIWVMSTTTGNDAVQLGPNLVLRNNQSFLGQPVGVLCDTVTNQVTVAWRFCVFQFQYTNTYVPQ